MLPRSEKSSPDVGPAVGKESAPAEEQFGVRLFRWLRDAGFSSKLGIVLTGAALVAGVVTYFVMQESPLGTSSSRLLVILIADLVILLSLGAVVMSRLVMIWVERRRGSAGSRLHSRLVTLFGLVAVIPAIILAVFTALFFNLGIQEWFSTRVRTALDEAAIVAESYVEDHRRTIALDARNLSLELGRVMFRVGRENMNVYLAQEARARNLTEIVVFDSDRQPLGRAGFGFLLEIEGLPNQGVLDQVDDREVVILRVPSGDSVRALSKVDGFPDVYVLIGRPIDPYILQHYRNNQRALQEYQTAEKRRGAIEAYAALLFIAVALLLLVVAVWIGLVFSNRLVRPISALVSATERVRSGDLTVRVAETRDEDEIGLLSRAFNRMASQLESQRGELVDANQQLDLRRRFTETVLAGVSSGVIGIDADGTINLPNRSALDLLGCEAEALVGRSFPTVVPEMGELFHDARARHGRIAEGEITLQRGRDTRRLLVRISGQRSSSGVVGYVATFDDISELVSAQRRAAWADVARRIAHEIKNPLTPIQLAAERLRRKYRKEITSNPEVFEQCTETIIRQVDDIGRMVDEFSAFARMPAPEFKDEDLMDIVRQVKFLQQVGHPDVDFRIEAPGGVVPAWCDRRQISQALTNILKNAAEALEGLARPERGMIVVRITTNAEEAEIAIEDNGRGFPAELRHRLTEPYVTTRSKGTGLGLAIVKKIMEEHRGSLVLEDRDGGGARVRLIFSRLRPSATSPARAAE